MSYPVFKDLGSWYFYYLDGLSQLKKMFWDEYIFWICCIFICLDNRIYFFLLHIIHVKIMIYVALWKFGDMHILAYLIINSSPHGQNGRHLGRQPFRMHFPEWKW